MIGLLSKATAVWLILVIMAIGNAAIREKLLAPSLGSGLALPVSGLLLSMFIFIIAFASTPFFGFTERKQCILVGAVWFSLTLSFELLFGHFVAAKPWHEIMRVFNVRTGDLFTVALFSTLIAPWLTAKLRGLL